MVENVVVVLVVDVAVNVWVVVVVGWWECHLLLSASLWLNYRQARLV